MLIKKTGAVKNNYSIAFLSNFLWIFFFTSMYAQKQGNVWYFGANAGLSFNSGVAVPLTDGAMSTSEGCASICDKNGNLLFYTDGIKVWNKNHAVMPNGSGLFGAPSSTQSAVIVPQPGNDSIYYIFTVDEGALPNGLQYSIVNMHLQSALGDVVSKNNLLLTPATEKLTAVLHANNTDIWVIAHGWNNNNFYAYRVTCSGIITTPIVSSIGAIHGTGAAGFAGQLKASPDGSKLGLAIYDQKRVELFDYNNSTGTVSNPIALPTIGDQQYGIEFSPDNSKLYVSTTVWLLCISPIYIFQFDLSSGNAATISGSMAIINTVNTTTLCFNYGQLQLGPDKKIYVARTSQDSLGVINNPNEKGAACNYVDNAIYLGGRQSIFGLPTFIQSYFNSLPSFFNDSNTCAGNSTTFSVADMTGIDSVQWNFGEPASGIFNKSVDPNTFHIYYSPGNYNVSLVMYHCGISDTFPKQITIYPSPHINLGPDTLVCKGLNLSLDATFPSATYLWQDHSTSSMLSTFSPGIYWVTVSDSLACSDRDTVTVSYQGCIADIYVPNSFSPNHDGINDTFRIVTSNLVTSLNAFIYNRFGNLIYSWHILDGTWDGTFKNNLVQEGVYVLQYNALAADGVRYEGAGKIVLVR